MLDALNAVPTTKNKMKAQAIYDFIVGEFGSMDMGLMKLMLYKMQRKIGRGAFADDMIDNLYAMVKQAQIVGRLATMPQGEPPSASKWLWLFA